MKKRNQEIKNSVAWLPVPLPTLSVTPLLKHEQHPNLLTADKGKRPHHIDSSMQFSPARYWNACTISVHKKCSKRTRKFFISKLSSRVKIAWWPLMSFHTARFSFWKLPLLMNTRLLSSPLFSPSSPSHKISWSSGHKEHPLSSCKSSLCSHFAAAFGKCNRSTIFSFLCKKSRKNRWRHHLTAILLHRKWCPAEMLKHHNLHFIFHVPAVLMYNLNLLLSFESWMFLSTHHKRTHDTTQYTRQTESETKGKWLEDVQRNISIAFFKRKRKKLKLSFPKRSWGHMDLSEKTEEPQRPAEILERGGVKLQLINEGTGQEHPTWLGKQSPQFLIRERAWYNPRHFEKGDWSNLPATVSEHDTCRN